MAVGQLSREAVLSAIQQWQRLGRSAFLEHYGFGEARDWVLRHEGQVYDSKAIAGVAYGYDHPGEGPLGPAAFSGGPETIRALEATRSGRRSSKCWPSTPTRELASPMAAPVQCGRRSWGWPMPSARAH